MKPLINDCDSNSTEMSVKFFLKFFLKFFSLCKTFILLIIYGVYEVIFVHKFFLYTFFRPSISDVPPPIHLEIGYWNKIQLKVIILMRYVLKDQFWQQHWLKRVHKSILDKLSQQKLDLSKLSMPIPTIDPETISGEEFWKTYVRKNIPVIIKGGANNTSAYQNWTLEMFQKRFGDFKVNVVNQSKNDEPCVRTFQDVIKENIDKLYISFCADIFSKYPKLVDELGCLEFRKHMGGDGTLFAGAQLFLGAKSSTGSDAHCAQGNNLFYQIRGKKKWTFVHPDYLWLMYPVIDRCFLFCVSFLKREYNQNYLDKYAPLQKYCPKFEAILEPGDILLNPTWQWHAIDNLTDESIAVATRWTDAIGQKHANTFFEAIQFFSLKIWRIRYALVSKNPDEIGLLDERTDDLVKDKNDFLLLGNESKIVPWELDKWPAEYHL